MDPKDAEELFRLLNRKTELQHQIHDLEMQDMRMEAALENIRDRHPDLRSSVENEECEIEARRREVSSQGGHLLAELDAVNAKIKKIFDEN